ncbi:NADH-quinone oxidoreductase subunit NuoH [Blastopirellula marina]|uniref:NADH-quinone oxidoreductase subunit H n=1 Tax=Blastopirellula marina DSM 3645 TaxID=314230 RepID=A3ZL02_9BACT|nr:NADH-quinone oxidoreductase subunit NuoH [Blastopirellula marina]EAQ82435.1 NADH dehydrogenase I chain H [Blastopirellula marina DSM 3645]
MADYFSTWFPEGWDWLGWLLAAIIQAVLLLHVIAVGAVVFIWMERKIAGRIQDRLGPTRTGGKFGWLQTLADGIKLLSKEDLMPRDADPLLFKLAPYISLAASFTAFLALPFASGWVGVRLNIALFFVIAVLGLEVFGVILAGYGSGSKWSLFGGMRQAAQVVSYEVPLGICVVVPVLISGTMDLVTIADQQSGLFSNWLFFHDPFCMLLFWVYFTCGIASVNRAPFDLAEAESELVSGFLTEYSGIRWSLFFMAEYGSMFLVSGLAAILFFGGWNGPIPIFFWVPEGNFTLETLANLVGLGNFLLKAVLGVVVMMWVRWTLPRLRIDQVISMCLKYCVPIAAFCFLGSVLWTALHLPFLNDVMPMQARGDVREGWVQDIDNEMQQLEKRLATEAYELNSAVEGGPQQEAQTSLEEDAADRVALIPTPQPEGAR